MDAGNQTAPAADVLRATGADGPRDARVPAAAPRRRRRSTEWRWHLVLAPTALVYSIPFVDMFLTSLTPESELNRFPRSFIPSSFTFAGYEKLFGTTDILHWLGNSLIVSTTSVISQVVLCSLAGYGFARLKFPGRTLGFLGIMGTIMIPTQLLMVPMYVMYARVGLVDTLGAAIVPWLASSFGIFLMRQFFLSIPQEMEEAARLDGCSRLRTFWHVILPLARPALATLAIFALLDSWNDLVWPLIAINDDSWYTIQLGIANFQGGRRTDWALLMCANVVATLPLMLFFTVAQKQFLATMTSSGVKG